MTIVDYVDRFASCTKRAAGEPCPKCDITREILTVLTKHVPDWETYLAKMRDSSITAGAEDFRRLLVAAEASIMSAIFLCMIATNSGDDADQPVMPEPAMWLEAFAGVLARELQRSGVSRRIAVVPRLDVTLMFDDPNATKH
jgi:hypothetical protein